MDAPHAFTLVCTMDVPCYTHLICSIHFEHMLLSSLTLKQQSLPMQLSMAYLAHEFCLPAWMLLMMYQLITCTVFWRVWWSGFYITGWNQRITGNLFISDETWKKLMLCSSNNDLHMILWDHLAVYPNISVTGRHLSFALGFCTIHYPFFGLSSTPLCPPFFAVGHSNTHSFEAGNFHTPD